MQEYDSRKAHYVIATVIIMREDGRYLIAKRASHEAVSPNEWTVPGGKLNRGEYEERPKDTSVHWYNVLEDLARREVMEEVGLEVKNIRYLTSLAYVRSDNIPTIIASFFADYAGGDIRLSKDLTEYAWVTLEEAKAYKLIEGIREELAMLDQYLKTGKMSMWEKE